MSRLLIDTHALLWWLSDDRALSKPARAILADPTTEPLVSSASVWEIAIKRGLGKLTVPDDLPTLIVDEEFSWLPVTPAHAWEVRELPMHHRDPFDRILIAQALTEQVPILTGEDRFSDYGVELRW